MQEYSTWRWVWQAQTRIERKSIPCKAAFGFFFICLESLINSVTNLKRETKTYCWVAEHIKYSEHATTDETFEKKYSIIFISNKGYLVKHSMHHVADQYRVPVILWVTGVIIRVMSVMSWLDDNFELVSINHYGMKETAFVLVRFFFFFITLWRFSLFK